MLRRLIAIAVVLSVGTVSHTVSPEATASERAGGTVTITEPASYQVFQRDDADEADVRISGSYSGTAAAIEARFNGGGWQVIDAAPSGGSFSGTLDNQPAGGGSLEARIAGDAASADQVDNVGVGDVFVVAGQSNAVGLGATNQPSPSVQPDGAFAGLFGNDDTWKALSDPYDSGTGQVDMVSFDAPGGSWVPALADHLIADGDGVPVAFIPAAKSSSHILQWLRNTSTFTLYGSMRRRIIEVGGGAGFGAIRAVLWMQGEYEANHGWSTDEYRLVLEDLAQDMYADFGAPTVVGGLVNIGWATDNVLETIRGAQRASAQSHPRVYLGPEHHDLDLGDNGGDDIHLGAADDPDGSAELSAAGARWWAAIDAMLGEAHDGRGPQFESATLGADASTVTVTFTNDSGVLRAGGTLNPTAWQVTDSIGDVGVTSASIVGTGESNTVSLTLARDAVGASDLAFGRGQTASGATVPTDSLTTAAGPVYLPVEPFMDVEIDTGADIVSVEFAGYYSYSTSAEVLSGDINVAKTFGQVRSLSGSVEIPGAEGGTATVSINASTFLPGVPLFNGRLSVSDPTAGFAASAPIFFRRFISTGTQVRGNLTWFEVQGFTFRGYQASFTYTEVA